MSKYKITLFIKILEILCASIQFNVVINCIKQGLRYKHINSHWCTTSYNYTLFTSMLIHSCGFLIFSEIYIAHISTFHKEGLDLYLQILCQCRITGYLYYYGSKWREDEDEKRCTSKDEKLKGRKKAYAMQFTGIPLIAMHLYVKQCY